MKRACPACGRIIEATATHCANHQPERATTSQRGYDGAHKRRRAQLLPLAIGDTCPLCGETMLADQELDLDHTIPLIADPTSIGDRIVHASCNVARSNRARAEARGAGRPIFADAHSPGTGFKSSRTAPGVEDSAVVIA